MTEDLNELRAKAAALDEYRMLTPKLFDSSGRHVVDPLIEEHRLRLSEIDDLRSAGREYADFAKARAEAAYEEEHRQRLNVTPDPQPANRDELVLIKKGSVPPWMEEVHVFAEDGITLYTTSDQPTERFSNDAIPVLFRPISNSTPKVQ